MVSSAKARGRLPVENPATGKVIGHLAAATPEEIEEAVAAARRAFPAWAAERPKARANALHRLGDLIAGDALNMARNMTIEQGKPVNEAQGEILKLAEICHFMAKKRLACKVTLCRMTLRVFKVLSCENRLGWWGDYLGITRPNWWDGSCAPALPQAVPSLSNLLN